MTGKYDRDYLEMKIRQIREGIDYHKAEVERLKQESDDTLHIIGTLQDFMTVTSQITKRLETMSETERFEVIRLLVDRVTVGATSLDVVMSLYPGRGLDTPPPPRCVYRP